MVWHLAIFSTMSCCGHSEAAPLDNISGAGVGGGGQDGDALLYDFINVPAPDYFRMVG